MFNRVIARGVLGIAAVFMARPATAQTVTDIFVPQVGVNGATTANRLPLAARISLGGLTANATYRYFSGGAIASDTGTSNGAGNYYGVTPGGTDGVIDGFTSNRSLGGSLLGGNENTSSSRYSEFTADASGNFTGWLAIEPTGNSRFNDGNTVSFAIFINNGAGGTSGTIYKTTKTFVSRSPGTTAGSATQVSFIGLKAGNPNFQVDEAFVLAWDNTAGTGDPIYSTFTENDGITTSGRTAYEALVGGTTGATGRAVVAIPNNTANGIRRIEYRDAFGTLLAFATSTDGVWNKDGGGTVDTKNPGFGSAGQIILVPEPATAGMIALFTAALMPRRRVG